MVKEMQAVENVEENPSMAPKCEIVHHTVVKQPKVVPAKATHQWGTTPVKPERQKEVTFHLSSVTADFYDTGLVRIMIYDGESRSRVLQFTNTRGVYLSGHLQKFLEIIQEVSDTFKINFAEFRNNTVEYNDHSRGETFRAVIDDTELSAVKKLATILSYLVSAPTLKADHVLAIARLQEKSIPVDGNVYLGNLRYFLFPYFDQATEMKRIGTRSFFDLTAENISGVYRLIGFIRRDDDTQTFKEYSESIGENYIPAAMGCDRKTAETAALIHAEWGTTVLKDVTLPILARLAELPMPEVSGNLKVLALNRILSGETMARELYDSLDFYLASLLTVEEYEDFFAQLSPDQEIPKEMGAFALEIIVRYYLNSGFSRVKELLDLVSYSSYSRSTFFYARTFFEIESPVRQKLKVEHFMLMLDEDYNEMPLGWAIPLIVAEIDAEKQEKAKKIDQLMKDGVLQIAA